MDAQKMHSPADGMSFGGGVTIEDNQIAVDSGDMVLWFVVGVLTVFLLGIIMKTGQQSNKSLKEAVSHLENELIIIRQKNAEQTSNLENMLTRERAAFKRTRFEMEETINKKKQELLAAQLQIIGIQEDMKHKVRDEERTRTEINCINREKVDLEEIVAEKEEMVRNFRSSLKITQTQIYKLKDELSGKGEEMSRRETEQAKAVEELMAEIRNLQSEGNELRGLLDDMKRKDEVSRNEINHLKMQVVEGVERLAIVQGNSQTVIHQQRSQLEATSKMEKYQATRKISELTEIIERLKAEKAEAQNMINGLQVELEEMKRKEEQAGREIEEIFCIKGQLETTLEKLNADLNTSQALVGTLKVELGEERMELQQVTKSYQGVVDDLRGKLEETESRKEELTINLMQIFEMTLFVILFLFFNLV